MLMLRMICLIAVIIGAGESCFAQDVVKPVEPRDETIYPFNGRDLTGFTTWLRPEDRLEDAKVYGVSDGTIHISGEGMGYLATVNAYQNYRLSVEYKWGERTDGSKFVRNSGILLHAVGPPGNARDTWMSSIEVQLAQGCEGDFIPIRGRDANGDVIPVSFTANAIRGADRRPRWNEAGSPEEFTKSQLWWNKHQVGFQELRDTRGEHDVASPLGEWTLVECICRGDRITVKINGKTVNQCYNVFPTAGQILLENEKNEIFFRNMKIQPLAEEDSKSVEMREVHAK